MRSPAARPQDFTGRRVAVLGLGISNRAVIRFLLRAGARIGAFDRQGPAALGDVAVELATAGVPLVAGADYLARLVPEAWEHIIVTPGMKKDLPVLRRARELRVGLHTEAGLVLDLAPAPTVGITGSAGKTTTTTLVGRIARRLHPAALVGGNIGQPLIETVAGADPAAWIVLELSSFQLELARRSPSVAAVLNLRPNHLDVHGSFAAYAAAKRNVFRFQDAGGVAVFPADDAGAAVMAAEAPGRVLRFSARGPVPAGAWLAEDGFVMRRADPGARAERVLPTTAIQVPGAHNLQDVLAAVAISVALDAPAELVAEVVAGFTGVEHRLEPVRELRGVRWINDSIATAPDRTEAALRTFSEPVVLLAGGYDKGIPFDGLAPLIAARARVLVLFGATADAIADAVAEAGGGPEVVRAADLDGAVAAAAQRARPGEVALLSPACASYDQFHNFEERGRRFKALVQALS